MSLRVFKKVFLRHAGDVALEPFAIGMAAYELNKSAPSLEREFPDLQLALAYKSRNRLSHGYLRRGPKHPLEYRVRVDTKNGCSRKIGEA